jgi:hypothetical protein
MIQIKALWLREGQEARLFVGRREVRNCSVHGQSDGVDECIAADPDLWFGETGIPQSRRCLPRT